MGYTVLCFASIYNNVTVQNCEIARCIILEDSIVWDVEPLLRVSLIGRNVLVAGMEAKKPRALSMNLADNSHISL